MSFGIPKPEKLHSSVCDVTFSFAYIRCKSRKPVLIPLQLTSHGPTLRSGVGRSQARIRVSIDIILKPSDLSKKIFCFAFVSTIKNSIFTRLVLILKVGGIQQD